MAGRSYDAFSILYRQAGFQQFADRIGRRIASQWKRTVPAGSRVLDLGCGTGGAVPALRDAGFRVVGVDLSLGMLRAYPALAIQADIRKLPLLGPFGAALALYDTVNHLPPGSLPEFFAEVARVLPAGAPFAFDVNTLEGSTMWVDDSYEVRRRDARLTVTSRFDAETRRLENHVRGWVQNPGGRETIEETIVEWYHPEEPLLALAQAAGFTLVDEDPLFMDDERPETPSKWLFRLIR